MSAEITEGGAHFNITAETSNLNKGVKEAINDFNEVGSAADKAGKKIDDAFKPSGNASELEKHLANLKNELKEVQEEIQKGGKYTGDLVAREGDLRTEISRVTKEISLEREQFANMAGSVVQLEAKLKSLNAEFRQLSPSSALGKEGQLLQKEIKETEMSIDRLKGKQEQLSKEMQLQKQVFTSAPGSVNQYKASIQLLTMQYEKLSDAERKSAAGQALLKQLNDNKAGLGNVIKSMNNAGDAATGMGNKIASGAGKAFSFLRTVANILPGLGIAGLIALISEAVVALVKELVIGSGALNEFSQKLKITEDALKSGAYADAKVKVAQFKNEINLAKEEVLDKDKVVKHYNETLGKTMGTVANFGEVEQKVTESGQAFIEMTKLKEQALIAYRRAAENSINAETESLNFGKFGPWVKRFLKSPGQWFNPTSGNVFDVQTDYIKGQKEQEKLMDKIGDDFNKKAADIANKHKFNFFDLLKDPKQKNYKSQIYNDTKAITDMLKEISEARGKYDIQFGSNIESEQLKIKKYFDDLSKKVDEFNKDPKRKVKLTDEQINKAKSDIESSRKYALGLANYTDDTNKLLKELDKQKSLYQDYEDFKVKAGKKAADELYKDQIDTSQSFIQKIQNETRELLAKQVSGLSLTSVEADRLRQLSEVLKSAEADEKKSQTKWLENALVEYTSFHQKRLAIAESYDAEIKKAEESGNSYLVEGIRNAKNNALAQVDGDNLDTITRTRQMFDDIVLITTESVKQQIEKIEYLLDNAALTPEQRNHLTDKLQKTKGLLNIPQQDRELQQAKDRLGEINRELEAAKEAGITTGAVIENLLKEKTAKQAEIASIELDKFRKKLQLIADLAPGISDLGQSLQELGGEGSALSEFGGVLSGIGSQLGNLVDVFDKFQTNAASAMDAYAAAAQFVISTINDVVRAAAQRKQAEKEYYLDRLQFQYAMNAAVLEELEVRQQMDKSSIATNLSKDMKDATERLKVAQQLYQKSFDDLSKAQVKLGQKNKIDWGATASSAVGGAAAGAVIGSAIAGVLAGAAAGSVVPVIGTVIGAAIGLAIGLFAKKKKKDVWGDLLKEYPTLIRITKEGNKEIDEGLAKQLIQYNLVSDETKIILQNIIDTKEAYKEIQTEISKIADDVLNDLGDKLRNSLVEAFKAGEDAASVFKKTVSDIIEELISQAAYAAIFQPIVDNLKKEMIASYDLGGDFNWIDDLMRFMEDAQGRSEAFVEFIRQAREEGLKNGLDLFAPNADKNKSTNTMRGSIQAQLTEETGSILAGVFKGVQLNTVELVSINKRMEGIAVRNLDYAIQTANNTYNTVIELKTAVVELKSINNAISKNADAARAAGF